MLFFKHYCYFFSITNNLNPSHYNLIHEQSTILFLLSLTKLFSLSKTLSTIFTIAQAAFYHLILCATGGTGNCYVNLFIYTPVWCGNHNKFSFSVYLDISDISPGNKFFQFFYCAFSQFLLKFLK